MISGFGDNKESFILLRFKSSVRNYNWSYLYVH